MDYRRHTRLRGVTREQKRSAKGVKRSSEEFPRDVETQVPVIVAGTATGQLRHLSAKPVREIELEDVSSGPLLDAKRPVIHARFVTRPRKELADDVHGRADAQACAEAV